MEQEILSGILTEYNQCHGLYSDFTMKIEGLLTELLKEKGIRLHSITARVKDRYSLEGKVHRAMGKYSCLGDITDIVGIRIVTYYADEVDAIADLVEREFKVDTENSVDKRELLDPDRFGYLSLHYVVQLPDKRTELTEYSRFKDCKAEIQIRSILQHTWAEIEHDMGYKSKNAIPKEIRRRFSRLAGLLELADMEFAKIREAVKLYETQVPQQIHDKPAEVEIDKNSLASFIQSSPLVHELDQRIVEIVGGQVLQAELFSGVMVDRLRLSGLRTMEELNASLLEHKDTIINFTRLLFTYRRPPNRFAAGVCLLYLCYVMVGRTGELQPVLLFLQNSQIAKGVQEVVAQEILTCIQAAAGRYLPSPE